MKKVLVTGAGGFIGSRMVDYLTQKGYEVVGVDIEYPEIRKKWFEKADTYYKSSVQMYDDIEDVFKLENPEWVFHFASDMGGVGYFHTHDYYPFLNNMEMDMNILDLCERYKIERLFYSSSACIYPIHLQQDTKNPPLLSEDMIYPAKADQMYGWEKLMMLQLCERSPLDARVGIFHTIYGEGQEFEGERAKFPPTIVKKVLDAQKTGVVEIWGDGSQLRTYCYIEDALEKIYRIMTQPYFGAVNVAGSELISVLDTARIVSEIVGISPNYTFTSNKPSGVMARGASNDKFVRKYGYLNKWDVKQGMKRMVDWVRSLTI